MEGKTDLSLEQNLNKIVIYYLYYLLSLLKYYFL